jgi:hypothetical protein
MKATVILSFALATLLASCQTASMQGSAEHGNVQKSQRIASEQRPAVINGNTYNYLQSQDQLTTSASDDIYLIFK